MRNQHCALGLALVIVVAAALVAIFHQSRTFPQLVGQSYAPDKVESIHIYLSPMHNGLPTRELTLTQEDSAAQDLLDLLGSQVYDVWYDVDSGEGHQILLDYTVYMVLYMEPEGEEQTVATVSMDGSAYMDTDALGPGGWSSNSNWVRTHYQADPAFQQEILDLLLAESFIPDCNAPFASAERHQEKGDPP